MIVPTAPVRPRDLSVRSTWQNSRRLTELPLSAPPKQRSGRLVLVSPNASGEKSHTADVSASTLSLNKGARPIDPRNRRGVRVADTPTNNRPAYTANCRSTYGKIPPLR
jgi:hypothetical protein